MLAATATKCIFVWFLDKLSDKGYAKSNEQAAVLLTRLPFGSSLAPAEFCNTSEMASDLAGDLLRCKGWVPDDLPSPHDAKLSNPHRLPGDVPFAQAAGADVKLGPSVIRNTDGYIDDGACAVLDAPGTRSWPSAHAKRW